MNSRARNIILLSDGTGNSRSKQQKTNVWHVYEALDVANTPDPLTPRQLAFYDDGIGSSSFKLAALLGGTFGWGLARNVRDLYGFLCRTYRPDDPKYPNRPKDRIYAFGFSRGAFTIRVLVGLIVNQGIVEYKGDEAELDRLVRGAYRAYRRRYKMWYLEPLRDMRDAGLAAWARLRGRTPYAKVKKIGAPESECPVEIEFLGLWDTVAAYGMPVDELTDVFDKFVWPIKMPNHSLDPRVKRAVHAMALDDERNAFHPLLWDASLPQPSDSNGEPQPPKERISQVWFAGMHSDVGGGYADQGLSHVTLDWVIKAAPKELRFVKDVRVQQHALSDENGPMNDSRRGLAGYYSYNPRRLEQLFAAEGGARPKAHESVVRRIKRGQDAYAPIVLPVEFDVECFDGTTQDGADFLGIDKAQQQDYAAGRERVFNLVWCKRVIYFATLLATLVLLALPYLSATDGGACTSWACFISPIIRALDLVVPDMFSGWTRWYVTHPGHFIVLAGLALFGLWLGAFLELRIGDAMRRVWYLIDKARPAKLARAPAVAPVRVVEQALQAVQWLRTRPLYQTVFELLRERILPAGFLVGLLYGVAVLGSVVPFAMRAASGHVCKASPSLEDLGAAVHTYELDTRKLCAGTGLRLEAGGTYRLLLTLPSAADGQPIGWKDSHLDADLRGVRPAQVSWAMRLATPLRREFTHPWLMPMARIGSSGADLYPLVPDPSVPVDPGLTVLEARIVARSSGELFLYVNDAVGPPGQYDFFYSNNQGTAQVTVTQVASASAPM
ncbi:MAG: DUF2235 domain-containing protein [Candidatus Dechloromonas phosphoritropha]